jgi:prephenate dehydrogenase
MAGRERSGVEFSDDGVFQGANFIVTPTEKNTPEAVALCRELGEQLGFARITELTPKKHDEMIAFLSQLTHCIAVTLMSCSNTPDLEKYTGDSFRDLTRIAKINDEMWSELFLLNRDELLRQMDCFAAEFSRFRYMLAMGDREGMRETMRASTARRAMFDKPKAKSE